MTQHPPGTSPAAHTRTSAGPHSVRTGHEVAIERDPASTPQGLSNTDALWPGRLRRIVRAALSHWGHHALAETAELLTTELTTNALRHGRGRDIGARIYLTPTHLVIEVKDGSPEIPTPRCVGPDDENGRGLLLVETLAEAWGVTPSGTTTWCTLPLNEGPPTDMQPAALTTPVLRQTELKIPARPGAGVMARIMGRTMLTLLGWPGNVHAAIEVLGHLVDNAVTHGLVAGKTKPADEPRAWLRVTEADELVIDVTDPTPEFAHFDAAAHGTLGRGLWHVRHYGARLSWFLTSDGDGKTVRATLSAEGVAL
ncbi:ATP-binding protein [Streptomyces parvulus]